MSVDPIARKHIFRSLVAHCCALLVLLGGLAGPLHHSLVRHAVCAEHGEVLHVADGSATPALERTQRPARLEPGAGPALAAGAEAGPDAHCVCEFVLTQRESIVSGAQASLCLPTESPQVSAVRAQTLICRSFPQFLLAPKHSPPA